jgi:hypothetical protein
MAIPKIAIVGNAKWAIDDRAIVYEIVNGELIDMENRSAKHGYIPLF